MSTVIVGVPKGVGRRQRRNCRELGAAAVRVVEVVLAWLECVGGVHAGLTMLRYRAGWGAWVYFCVLCVYVFVEGDGVNGTC